MSAMSSSSLLPEGAMGRIQSQDFDLNLAPIIDCFVVLIAFVMISTAFASIGILDAGLAAGGRAPTAASEPEVRLRIDLNADGAISLRVSGKETRELTVAPLGEGKRDTVTLDHLLADLKAKWPSLGQARLAAGNKVAYQDVVTSIETIRKTFPGISLDGI